MTHDEMIAVIRAAAQGKAIEFRHNGGGEWNPTGVPLLRSEYFNFSTFEYRIKPEPPKPREWCCLLSESGSTIAGGHEITDCRDFCPNNTEQRHPPGTYIHVREVL